MRLVHITAKHKFFGACANNCPKFEPLQAHMEQIVTRSFWAEGPHLLQNTFLTQKGFENVRDIIATNPRRTKIILDTEPYVYDDGMTPRKDDLYGPEMPGIFEASGEDIVLAKHWLLCTFSSDVLNPWSSRWGNGADVLYNIVSLDPYETLPYIEVQVLKEYIQEPIDSDWDMFLFPASKEGLHNFAEFVDYIYEASCDAPYGIYEEYLYHNVVNVNPRRHKIQRKEDHPTIERLFLPSAVEKRQYNQKVTRFNGGNYPEHLQSIGNFGLNNVEITLASGDPFLPSLYIVVEVREDNTTPFIFRPDTFGFDSLRRFLLWLKENYASVIHKGYGDWTKYMPHNALGPVEDNYYYPGPTLNAPRATRRPRDRR